MQEIISEMLLFHRNNSEIVEQLSDYFEYLIFSEI